MGIIRHSCLSRSNKKQCFNSTFDSHSIYIIIETPVKILQLRFKSIFKGIDHPYLMVQAQETYMNLSKSLTWFRDTVFNMPTNFVPRRSARTLQREICTAQLGRKYIRESCQELSCPNVKIYMLRRGEWFKHANLKPNTRFQQKGTTFPQLIALYHFFQFFIGRIRN